MSQEICTWSVERSGTIKGQSPRPWINSLPWSRNLMICSISRFEQPLSESAVRITVKIDVDAAMDSIGNITNSTNSSMVAESVSGRGLEVMWVSEKKAKEAYTRTGRNPTQANTHHGNFQTLTSHGNHQSRKSV